MVLHEAGRFMICLHMPSYSHSLVIAHKIFVSKPEGKRPLRKPRHKWEDIIRMDPREIGSADGDWIHLAWDRDQWQAVVNTLLNLQFP
jgi:hypothetical protein